MKVLFDTSYLITLSTPERPNSETAKQYFKLIHEKKFEIIIPTIVIAEYAVCQDPHAILMMMQAAKCVILDFNYNHAIKAASLERLPTSSLDRRNVIINDKKILAQVLEENVPFVLTEDENTLCRYIKKASTPDCPIRPILLKRGFNESAFEADMPLFSHAALKDHNPVPQFT